MPPQQASRSLSGQQAGKSLSGSRAADFIDPPGNHDRASFESFDFLLFRMGFLKLGNSFVECGKLGMKLVELFAILMVFKINGFPHALRLHWLPPNCVTPL
jgi:hypothetical protein